MNQNTSWSGKVNPKSAKMVQYQKLSQGSAMHYRLNNKILMQQKIWLIIYLWHKSLSKLRIEENFINMENILSENYYIYTSY
jgi:hypothetical protein